MSLGIKIYHVQDFIRKNEAGHIDMERSMEIIKDVSTAANFHADSNILVDLRQTTVSPVYFSDLTNLTEEFIRLVPQFRNKIAVIIPDEPERRRLGEKLELCMRLHKVRYSLFTDYEKALDWLSDIKS